MLKNILTPIVVVDNFPSCFEIKTQDLIESYVICVENENTARNWILAITQNVINCNWIHKKSLYKIIPNLVYLIKLIYH